MSRDPTELTSTPARALPQPIESTTSSSTQSPKARKFAPQVIETSRRSRRNTANSDTTPLASSPADTTAFSPDHHARLPKHMRPSPIPRPPDNSPTVSSDQIPQAPESKFSSSKLAEKAPRRHSFRVPDLPVIPSTAGSNDSSDSSADSDHTQRSRKKQRKRDTQTRESQDERTSGYLLALAAKAAEKQLLREQAMAAYPNENFHEPVDHYAIDRDSEDDFESGVGQLSLGDGSADGTETEGKLAARPQRDSEGGGWDMAEMRKHRDKLEQQRRDQWESEEPAFSNIGATDPNLEFHKVSEKPAAAAVAPPKHWQEHEEMKAMLQAAAPPMAGQNLRFPRCQSPRNTRLDVHQYPGQHKHDEPETRQHTGLWTPGGGASRKPSQSGLWMGVNAASAQEALAPPRFLKAGLMTPAAERGDPFSTSSMALSRRTSYVPASSLPPSPPSSQEEGTAPSSKLCPNSKSSSTLEAELNDAFVTQVYNYLSLGYPSLARPFDEELAKISQTDVETLRKDDQRGNAKGYVGAPEGTGMDVRGCSEGACGRWMALRKYVNEWGRQQSAIRGAGGPGWEKGELSTGQGGWGARARKGSWAI